LHLRVADLVARGRGRESADSSRLLRPGGWQGELELRRRDGDTTPVEARSTTIPLPAGPVFVSICRDISGRRPTEQALRESEARFRSLADTAPVLIWMADVEGACSYVNRVWLEFTGRTLAEELGHGWADVIHPEDGERTRPAYLAALAAREPYHVEIR